MSAIVKILLGFIIGKIAHLDRQLGELDLGILKFNLQRPR